MSILITSDNVVLSPLRRYAKPRKLSKFTWYESNFVPPAELNVTNGDIKILIMDLILKRTTEDCSDPWKPNFQDKSSLIVRRSIANSTVTFSQNGGFAETIGCIEKVWVSCKQDSSIIH